MRPIFAVAPGARRTLSGWTRKRPAGGGELKAGRDEIPDLARGKDLIDLSAIDARAATAEDDALDLIGRMPFSGEAGELRYRVKAGDAIVRGDTYGDGRGDFAIRVVGIQGLDDGDFIA